MSQSFLRSFLPGFSYSEGVGLWSVIAIILGFGQPAWAGVRPSGLRHLGFGTPGCFEWIRSRAAGASEVAGLPESCRQMRTDYHRVLETVHQDRKGLLGQVGKVLRSARSDRSPYEAMLFSVLFNDRSLLPALKEREKIEKKKKLRFQYATAAIGRVETGRCPVAIQSLAELRELCQVRDSVLSEAGVTP